MDTLTCPKCQKHFSAVFNLRKHAKKFHSDTNINNIVPKKEYKYRCKQCNRNFNRLLDFKYHEKKGHSSVTSEVTSLPSSSCEKVGSSVTFQCSLCQLQAPKDKLLIHFKIDHNIQITSENMEFGTFQKFLEWKQNMEATSHSHFVKERGNYPKNDKIIVKYVCHRSGNFFSKGKGLRALKTQGSNKINGFCPASLNIEINKDDTCKVTFVKNHVGHENDLEHLFITASERELLTRQMALKIPFTEILDQVRDSVQGSDKLERIHLLTRRDLYNIEKGFNLQSIGLGNDSSLALFENPANDEIMGNLTGLSKNKTRETNMTNKEEEIFLREKENVLRNLIPDLVNVVENMTSMEEIHAFKKLCAPIAPTINAIKNKRKEIGKLTLSKSVIPHNKKIVPQRGILHSTKKKKLKDVASKHLQPSTQEKQQIALSVTLMNM